MSTLQSLIDDAIALANPDETMHGGRLWRSVGGRACPIGWEHCSQPVFEDVRTGATDYGETGGPGLADCMANCRERMIPPEPEDDGVEAAGPGLAFGAFQRSASAARTFSNGGAA